jgi:LPXTG-motif cell wall-anchored protein
MKRFKKMMAIAIACAMIIGTMSFGMLGASAADEIPSSQNYQRPISITGLDPGDSVAFYQLVKWVGTGTTPNTDGWQAVAPLTDAQLAAILGRTPTGITAETAGEIARTVTKSNIPAKKTETADETGKATYQNPESGMYMALITPKDQDTVYNPVFVSANYGSQEESTFDVPLSSASYVIPTSAAAKKSKVTVEKEAKNAADYNEDDGDTAAVGDTLTFTVKATIPGYGNTFIAPYFILKDTVVENLAIDPDSIEVSTDGDIETTDYTIDPKTASGYTITFATEYLKKQTKPVEVTVTYNATVTKADTVANINKETNEVTIQYSHDPKTETDGNEGGDKQFKKDITNHYTFSIDADNLFLNDSIVGESGSELIKVAVDKDGNPIVSTTKTYSNITRTKGQPSPLEGAEFALYKVNKSGQKTGDAIATTKSDAAGRIKFEGLDAGTYILVETQAPSGYKTDSREHTIVIDAQFRTVKATEYYDQDGNWWKETATGRTAFTYEFEELESYTITFDGQNAATHKFMHDSTSPQISWKNVGSSEAPASITNTKGVELPSTGGMGTTLFYIIGAILIIGAGVLLVTRRRTESAEE